MSKTLISFLFLFICFYSVPVLSSLQTIGLDAFLAEQSRRDPLAANDSFPAITSALKKSLALSPPSSDHTALISHLLSLQISVPVYVKLVGPFSPAAPGFLHSFVSAALSSARFHAIGAGGPSHHLAVSHSLHLEPSLSPLDSQIFAAIRSHIDSAPSPLHRASLLSVPYSVVDGIIHQDFVKDSSTSAPGFYIYLLNLAAQSKPYAYAYDGQDASPAYSKCLGSLWTGAERYVWIDLAAGPVDYGPAISGEGALPRGEFHPLASLHRGPRPRPEKPLLGDLASLVLSAYQALLVPSLRIPVYYEMSLLIQFIHIRGSDDRDPTGLDFTSVERTLKESELVFGNQPLKFKSYSAKLSECPICSFAISRSTNSFTSRFLFENYTLIVSEYLDSKRLHQILSDSVDEMHRAAGIEEEEFAKILPVYVFDLEYDKLLMLDRYHQAIAFRDMVIAVRTKSSQTVSDYSCNGRHVITQTRNLNRPIVGSILQSMWGISPTHLSWSPQHNSTLVDYTWSVGQTPFGPFSESLSLSFVQKDAARRNVLLTTLNYTITSAIEVMESMAAHGGDRKLLKKNRHVEFVQRWNLLKYKLEKVLSAMSQLDFDKAMYFLRSSDHDLYAIHTLVYQASQELEASLVCFKDPPFPWASASMAVVFLFAFFYLYAKRGKIFKNKRKRF